MSPALAGGFLTTVPLEKSLCHIFSNSHNISNLFIIIIFIIVISDLFFNIFIGV